MSEQFVSGQPIYLQIMQRVTRQIVRGDLAPGEKLMSVREMAIQYGVNPNTMQRVNAELERMGIVETRRGQGTFVTEEQEKLVYIRKDLMDEEINQFIAGMREMGYTDREIVDGVRQFLRQEHDDMNNGGEKNEQ